MMFITLEGYNGQEETIEAIHITIKPVTIRCYLEGDKEVTLYFCGTNENFWREYGWRNLDTGEQWKSISICPK